MDFACWVSGAWAVGSWVVGSWCPGTPPTPVVERTSGGGAFRLVEPFKENEDEIFIMLLTEILLNE